MSKKPTLPETHRIGLFDVPMEEYLKAPGVSRSALVELARSPAHCHYYETKATDKPTRPMMLGTVLHTAVFQPEIFGDSHWVRPATYEDEKTGKEKPWNGNSNVCKEWIIEHSDRDILTQDERKNVEGMARALIQHKGAATILENGRAERSAFVKDPASGLYLKVRFDWLSGNVIADLKSCRDASRRGFSKTIANFWYEMQAAFYLHVAHLLDMDMAVFMFLAVESEEPHPCATYQLKDRAIERGRDKFKRLLDRYAECQAKSDWPGYSQHIENIDIPEWAHAIAEQDTKSAEFPEAPAYEIQ